MKKLILFLTLQASLAHGIVVERNLTESKIYFHPTPVLKISLLDLDQEGGLLTYFLEYDSELAAKELEEVKGSNPNLEISTVMAEASEETMTIDIPLLGLSSAFPLKQGQMGPYLNSQLLLSFEQLKKLKGANKDLASLIKTNLKLKTNINFPDVVESYKSDPEVCNNLASKNVGELILSMTKLKKPAGIKFAETFISLKHSLLEQCFEVSETQVKSFTELLKVPVHNVKNPQDIVGNYVTNQSHAKQFSLVPPIVIEASR